MKKFILISGGQTVTVSAGSPLTPTPHLVGQNVTNVTSILTNPILKTTAGEAGSAPTISLIAQPSAGEVPTTLATRQIVTLPSQMSLAGML